MANYPGLFTSLLQFQVPLLQFPLLTDPSLIPAFLAAIDQEARLYQDQFPTFDSLFLGGDTPSLLNTAQLAALMKNLRRHFVFAPDSEITLEANPDDLTADKLTLFATWALTA